MGLRHLAILLLGWGWGCAAERPPGVRESDSSNRNANDPDRADAGLAGSSNTGSSHSTSGTSGSDDPTSDTEMNDGNSSAGGGTGSEGGATTAAGGGNASGGAAAADSPGSDDSATNDLESDDPVAVPSETDPSAAGSGPDSSVPLEMDPSETDPSTTEYPPGPYGDGSPVVGEVIENLSLRGFVNPTGEGLALDAEYRDFSLAELRDDGAEYAVLLMAAVWCSSCRLSTLVAGERGHEVFDAGGTVLELLLDGATSQTPPTEAEIRAWADAYELPMTTVGPVDARARQVFTDREYAYIVELETMTVVWRHNMLYGNPTIVDLAIDTFLTDFQ